MVSSSRVFEGPSAPADVESNETARTMDAASLTSLVESWGSSKKNVTEVNTLNRARNNAREVPAALEAQRSQKRRDEAKRKREEERNTKREAEQQTRQAKAAQERAAAQKDSQSQHAPSEDDDCRLSEFGDLLFSPQLAGERGPTRVPLHVSTPVSAPGQVHAPAREDDKDHQIRLTRENMNALKAAILQHTGSRANAQQQDRAPAHVAATEAATAALATEREKMRQLELVNERLSAQAAARSRGEQHQEQRDIYGQQQQQQLDVVSSASHAQEYRVLPPQVQYGRHPSTPNRPPCYLLDAQHQSRSSYYQPDPSLLLTPLHIQQVKEQIRRARNLQCFETDSHIMTQRSTVISDLEAEVKKYRNERRCRRAEAFGRF
eukprot:2808501-Pleurochrysis_carterae.AAC.8